LAASDPGVDHPQIPVFLGRNRQDDAVRPENRVDRTRCDWAVIDVPVNRSERVFYRRNVDVAKITLPWRKRD
jgi:hypothetical protein